VVSFVCAEYDARVVLGKKTARFTVEALIPAAGRWTKGQVVVVVVSGKVWRIFSPPPMLLRGPSEPSSAVFFASSPEYP